MLLEWIQRGDEKISGELKRYLLSDKAIAGQ
jgi:hypothetical protein